MTKKDPEINDIDIPLLYAKLSLPELDDIDLDPFLNELDLIGRNILAINNHPFLEVVACNDVMGKIPNTPVQHSVAYTYK